MSTPKILAFAGSTRSASFNKRGKTAALLSASPGALTALAQNLVSFLNKHIG